MGTLTADCPALASHCPHKLATSCRLTSTPNCCACADERQHSSTYRVYVDGVGFVQRGTRWQGYCWFCKEFWTNRLAATYPPLDISQTRIPTIPDQTEFIQRWFEFHRGYRIVKLADGTEQRIAVSGEALKEVSPGFLPRTLTQLGAGVRNDARRPENRLRRRRLSSEVLRPEEPQESLDEALDNLLQEASDDDTAQPDQILQDNPAEPAGTVTDRQAELQRRARERLVRVFGSHEDIQHIDYESPLTQMYSRAYDRYRQAEAQRADGTATAPSLDGLSTLERFDVEEQLLLGVIRESMSESIEQEGDVWSYAPVRTEAITIPTITSYHPPYHPPQANPEAPTLPPRDSFGSLFPQLTSPLSASDSDFLEAIVREDRAFLEESLMNTPPTRPLGRVRDRQQVSHPLPTNAAPRTSITTTSVGPTSSSNTAPTPPFTGTRATIQQITSELQRLRHTSEALSSARDSQHARNQPSPPPPSLDNQPDRPAPLTDVEMTKTLACQVCYQQLANIAVLPCGHMVMCQWCADVAIPVRHSHLPVRASRCPMCRKSVKQRFKIHM